MVKSHSLGSVVDPGEVVVETNAWERFGFKGANDDIPVAFVSHDACRLGIHVLQADPDRDTMKRINKSRVAIQGGV